MRTEVRFVLAILLMVGVLVATNLLFPPVLPEGPEGGAPADSVPGAQEPGTPGGTDSAPDSGPVGARPGAEPPGADTSPDTASVDTSPADPAAPTIRPDTAPTDPGERIVVEGPLYRYTFSDRGARLLSARLLDFESFVHEGSVELVPPEAGGVLGHQLAVGADTLDLSRLRFEVEPREGLTLEEGGGAETLTFRHTTGSGLAVVLEYTFRPGSYISEVRGRVDGARGGLLFTELGPGLAFNESHPEEEARAMAYVGNHLEDGIRSRAFEKVEERTVEDGPFRWAALKSKYFVLVVLPGLTEESPAYLGGLLATPSQEEGRARVVVTQSLGSDGAFAYRIFAGPQEYARLSSVGQDLEDVNPYGWRFFRPIVRPFVAVIMTILVFLHENLEIGYGWVLILFGVAMRVLLFPLNQKAMRAQLRNMAVQPLVKEIQTKYKNDPERLQKEMMKLYKEHGFNPLAGCLPMLLPWPVLIALFFVFQNTIELRGVPFLWLPDLSAPDPLYILPAFLGVSMFLLQFVSLRSMDEPNPQMKMMMWVMPVVMVVIFVNFASGLNLYYATANVATLPQQYWIAQERKKAKAKMPVRTE